MKTFRLWMEEINPPWMLGEVSIKLLDAIALTCDVLGETMVEALYMRFLYNSELPDDALTLLGRERLMPRYGFETSAGYKERLKGAWNAWTFAGTRQSVLDQLAAAGFPDCQLYENWEWDWDGHPEDWSRFWVVVRSHPWTAARWGEFDYGDGTVYGSSMTVADQQALRSIVRQWKAGHTRCEFIIIVNDTDAWDAAMPPDGSWGNEENRPPNAAYIPG